MSLIGKVYTAQDMRDAAKCLFACEVDLKHDNRDIAKMLRQAADMMDRAVGNAAAMREALEQIANMGEQIDNQLGSSEETVYAFRNERCIAHNISEYARAAISAPARNCDIGTAEEQIARFNKFCFPIKCSECQLHTDEDLHDCIFRWAQMPYEAGGEK